MKQKTAIVTGSTGFIGSHLVQRLLNLGIKTAGLPRDLLLNPNELQEYIKSIKPNYIFHLAAYGNHSTQTDFNETVATNIIKTAMLFSAVKDIKLEAFINFGSSSEYGKKDMPMSENSFLEPDTYYGATKAASTLLGRAFAVQHAKPVVTVRPFSVYGEGEADFRFIPTVIKSLVKNTTMPLDGRPMHDWIYVQDFIDGVIKVVKNADKLAGQVVNIGTGIQYSNDEVAQELERISGKQLLFDAFGYFRKYDNTFWVADNNKLLSLGWKPKHTLKEGLTKTYEYYQQRFKEKNS